MRAGEEAAGRGDHARAVQDFTAAIKRWDEHASGPLSDTHVKVRSPVPALLSAAGRTLICTSCRRRFFTIARAACWSCSG